MKLLSLINLQFENFYRGVNETLSEMLSTYKEKFGPNTIFGQFLTVLGSVSQNILVYIEDSLTEHNKYTAQRKRSVYSLASISGYEPSMGKTTAATVAVSWKPNNVGTAPIVIPNKTKLLCSQTGLCYNIVIPQEVIIMSLQADNSTKYLTIAEGTFETQTFIASGGQLYSQNIKFTGDTDLDYLEVYVNDEKWERVDSLYDMDPESNQYLAKTSIKSGFDLVFGNSEHGRALKDGDVVKVTYLIHNGEMGNITEDPKPEFTFYDKLGSVDGEQVNGNQVFDIQVVNFDSVSSGTYSDTTEQVRQMIGMNSRALVLSDAKNYKKFFNKLSFVGYSRVWSEPGSMIVNSLIMNNYKSRMKKGEDYFSLSEDDFRLSPDQKRSIYNAIAASGEQLAGVVFNIFDPEICKYACYIYVKLKDGDYDRSHISNQIKTYVGEFFSDLNSDIFIPKSDIIHMLKKKIPEADGIDVYFLSAANEEALMKGYYTEREYTYNLANGTYKIMKNTVRLYDDENPCIGLDGHGNILLDNNDQYPVLMGGWSFKNTPESSSVSEPITIVFE